MIFVKIITYQEMQTGRVDEPKHKAQLGVFKTREDFENVKDCNKHWVQYTEIPEPSWFYSRKAAFLLGDDSVGFRAKVDGFEEDQVVLYWPEEKGV